ncbi:transcription factor Tos4, partial [Paraphaeosphaeria sporulosa]
ARLPFAPTTSIAPTPHPRRGQARPTFLFTSPRHGRFCDRFLNQRSRSFVRLPLPQQPIICRLPALHVQLPLDEGTTRPRCASSTRICSMDSSPSTRAPQLPLEPEQQRSEHTQKPSLLPAFEPLSSSPFPRPSSSKRKLDEDSPTHARHHLKYYPTPVPTSSTGILASSSPQKRPVFERTISALSERQPLGAVPSVDLPANGDIIRMGRSSNSSDYQLSANRLISRVHVQSAYYAPTASYPNGYIEVECIGWNGAKIHCGGNVFELNKGDTYMSENPEQEILLDVQDTRVMIAWPQVPAKASWDSEDDVLSPTRRHAQDHFASSPPLIPRSPVSQSPIRQPVFGAVPSLPPPMRPVQIFEDEDAREDNGAATPTPTSPLAADETFIRPPQSRSNSGPDVEALDTKASIGPSFNEDGFSDGDEENDPIVHSFGPFGQDLNSRLASFSTATPIQPLSAHRRRSLMKSASPRKSSSSELVRFKESPIKNHIINQLAYSRIHSQPLSAIHSNLPAELKACQPKKSDGEEGSGASTPVPQFSKQDLRQLMDRIPCIGEIPRSGKDAAGQPLENEFYYVPEMDSNMLRRETVGVRGTGLRSVRKQHKQYYWKKPRV